MLQSNLKIQDRNIKLKVLSFNARGLRNSKKRKTIFYLLKNKKYDIICLQETYLSKNDSSTIEKEWGHSFHMSDGTNNSKGILTLFNNKSLGNCSLTLIDSSDRCLVSCIKFENSAFILVNVYAPCVQAEKIIFLDDISRVIANFCENTIYNTVVFGDFNMVLNNDLDIIEGQKHNTHIVNKFNAFKSDLLLVDVWRELHGRKKEFTWCRKNPFIARRLDYIFTSESLLPFCKDANIEHFGFSDHNGVSLVIDFSSFKRGRSSFKFNVSRLKKK